MFKVKDVQIKNISSNRLISLKADETLETAFSLFFKLEINYIPVWGNLHFNLGSIGKYLPCSSTNPNNLIHQVYLTLTLGQAIHFNLDFGRLYLLSLE
jgi:hypothetical protein